MKSKKVLSAVLASALCVGTAFACLGMTACKGKDKENGGTTTPPGGTTTPPEGGTPEQDTSVKFKGKIYLVGDSTVCDYEFTQGKLDDAYLPRYGYATQLYRYLNVDQANVKNYALSGRSSLSYLTDNTGFYDDLTTNIGAGDYLIIGFGHNDEKTDAGKYTNPTKSYTDDSTAGGVSLQYNLYENYIKKATEKGATAILCTPIVRYNPNNSYTGNDSVHVTSSGDYAEAIRTLASATNTPLVDMTALTKAVYSADNANAIYYHYHDTYEEAGSVKTPSGLDKTHLNMYGAKMAAYQFAQGLKQTDCSLKNSVKTDAVAPTKATDYEAAINSDYSKPVYTAPNLASYNKITTLQTTTPTDWYGTVFGDIGGNTKYTEYTSVYSNEKFTVGNDKKQSGKFASAGDGFGAAFIQVDANKDFKASVDIKITSLTSTDDIPKSANSQSGVGLMIRDDIYNNLNSKSIKSNFIASGTFAGGAGAIFSHEEGALKAEGNPTTVAVGSLFHAEIERSGTSTIVTFKVLNGETVTQTYTKTYLDVKLNKIDADYMYLCLFANRSIVAEFSNVRFEITGDAQGA